MIRTKTAFIVFLILSLIIFPYYIIYLQSDFLSSIVPGWNTNIFPGEIMGDLLKFLILIVTVYFYWKLSKILNEFSFRRFIVHFLLTLPAIIISKISYYEFFNFNTLDAERLIQKTHLIVYSITLINVMFFISQALFWRFYSKTKRAFSKHSSNNL
ncbi:hypothetical protein [Flavobacterium branchiicola]|uniref:Uncharacterized protein n=1 Tax=Flavobacterium branchiicola TaxID=1114875 RepID=A0ABV9P9X7_9FLAO|nr:hypothetical protein [Flavobacterium branchiicola]MBS7253372.1 hypothetical protein [Flavobacterium branchiicola]